MLYLQSPRHVSSHATGRTHRELGTLKLGYGNGRRGDGLPEEPMVRDQRLDLVSRKTGRRSFGDRFRAGRGFQPAVYRYADQRHVGCAVALPGQRLP